MYSYISISQKDKRTDYPGREISDLVQKRWDRNFSNEIKVVVGDEWSAGNLLTIYNQDQNGLEK